VNKRQLDVQIQANSLHDARRLIEAQYNVKNADIIGLHEVRSQSNKDYLDFSKKEKSVNVTPNRHRVQKNQIIGESHKISETIDDEREKMGKRDRFIFAAFIIGIGILVFGVQWLYEIING
jgi:hypothetical protein